jgi:hypothetical protein
LNGLAIAILAVGLLRPSSTSQVARRSQQFRQLFRRQFVFLSRCTTFAGETLSKGIGGVVMTQFLTLMIAPVGALMIGFLMLFITRKDRRPRDVPHKPDYVYRAWVKKIFAAKTENTPAKV